MDTKYITGIVVVIVVLVGGYFFFVKPGTAPVTNPETAGGNSAPLETTNPGAQNDPGLGASVGVSVGTPVTVTYTDSGFSPKSVTIKKGQSVTWVNKSSRAMWIGSASHPDHTGYDGTSRAAHCAAGYTGPAPFDECGAGTSYTFTFNEVGTWGYHNHAGAQDMGVVIVTE